MSAGFTREDMVDAIATAISDSFDVDWSSRTGAEAVVRNCGVFELYEALAAIVTPTGFANLDTGGFGSHAKAMSALAKARGDTA